MTEKTCPTCRAEFACGRDAPGCWCAELPSVKPVPGTDCLCRACLEEKLREQTAPGPRS